MAEEEYPRVYLYRRVVSAKLFIDTHYAQAIDLDNITDEALFSKFHFIRLFKKIYGKTPHQYVTFVRIEKATQLLRSGTAVTDVCYEVGFESISSFSGLFKRMVGIAPSVYAEQQRALQDQLRKQPLGFVPGCFAGKNGWNKKAIFEK
ncbi:MAG TPA: AraC family transcriptional regulator [Ohtaekwangia sp.]|uniref:AraC family transcriptional regulator n=1 Tax=Ohtaekwangia sp. TaxID=2066019 RepID=UPI002F93B02F